MNSEEAKFKQVIVVRGDIKMSVGKTAVQVAHASLSAYIKSIKINRDWCEKWIKQGQAKIVCVACDINELMKLIEKAKKLGIPFEVVVDRGLTEVPPGTLTCVGFGPAPSNLIDKVTGSLRLLK